MSRFARRQRVFFIEEPVPADGPFRMEVHRCPESRVYIATPHLPHGTGFEQQEQMLRLLLDDLLTEFGISDFLLWYYTPMALGFSRHLNAPMTVFDCMDELGAFKDAPPLLRGREIELMARADLVFTGGRSLYEAKRGRHGNAHCVPSSVDMQHFAQARKATAQPEDQAEIGHPRIGYCGVIDERMDIDLLAGMAAMRPEWHFVMVGPVVKIDPATLPRRGNIHYLGGKDYKELPAYLAGWEVAMLPFARNESTRFISPTKTPEYLAAGRPVVSTSIRDVVHPYGVQRIVRIADTPADFVREIERAMSEDSRDAEWNGRVESILARSSWDATWQRMWELMQARLAPKPASTDTGAQVHTVVAAHGD